MSKSITEILFDRLFDSIFDANFVGKIGERRTEKELKLVKLFGRDGMILRNVYIPKDNGETSEIDVLFICQKGIIVIESKNYSGWIFGNEKDFNWTVSLANGTKNKFYNPIKQNRNHLKWLGQYIGEAVPLFSMVAFSERCELKNVTVTSSDVLVLKRERVYDGVRRIWESNPDVLDENKIQGLYDQLSKLTNADEAIKQAHVNNINQKYKDGNVCPLCGGELILRTAKKGANAGNQFWGCSNYPRCKYVRNVNS